MSGHADFGELVRPDQGLVRRSIFHDEEVYNMELQRIFARCWLYLGLESELKQPGDYLTTYMGEDPVIVSRDQDGRIHAFLNSCRHRGNRICKADAGNAAFFRCSYHGWTYGNDGRLVGVPFHKLGYNEELELEKWGLLEVPKLVVHKGMIWASWDTAAPPFDEYLGGMGFYLDLLVGRMEGGVEVIGGVQKWVIPTNWKIPADNFVGDSYHAPTAHRCSVELGLRQPRGGDDYEINAGYGHGFGGKLGGIGLVEGISSKYSAILQQTRERLAKEKGEFVTNLVPLGHFGIFPNFSALDIWQFRLFRVWHPRGPRSTEVYAWCVVDKALPEEVKMEVKRQYTLQFGPSGVFEQDDAENWSQVTASTRGWVGRQLDFNYQMGLNRERPAREVLKADLPGKIAGPFHELNQREFYRRWLEMIKADGWQSISRKAK